MGYELTYTSSRRYRTTEGGLGETHPTRCGCRLATIGLVGGGLTLGGVSGSPAGALGSPAPATPGATTTPIKHLVVIFDENVSFDHYFGTYPYAANPLGEPAFHAKHRDPHGERAVQPGDGDGGPTGPLLTNNGERVEPDAARP